ncbi:MAG: glycosyltransferase family 2 protein [Symploca sp. SIO2E6]|nr:glycosyltransferase family 2 protein [Symploca sp. SIO2E6]
MELVIANKIYLSIGLPVYNGEQFLEESLNSLLAQTLEDFELIISDNGSTDRTEEICRTYAAQEQRIRYHRSEQNHGAAWNYNRCFELSVGKYFKWACHDDLCAPEYVERCIQILEAHPSVVLCYANTTFIDEQGNFLQNYSEDLHLDSPKPQERYRQYHRRFLYKYKCNPQFGVIRSSALGMTRLMGKYEGSDIILFAELAMLGEFYEIPEYLFFRRDHPKMSRRANPTEEELAVWYDPANKGKLQLPMSRLLWEHLLAIWRTNLSWPEKISCYLQLRTFLRWKRRELGREFIKAAKWLIG